jgi:hypothetical protein
VFAIRNKSNPNEWIITHPGGRLDHWGPAVERAEFGTVEEAKRRMRIEFAFPDQVAEVVEV